MLSDRQSTGLYGLSCRPMSETAATAWTNTLLGTTGDDTTSPTTAQPANNMKHLWAWWLALSAYTVHGMFGKQPWLRYQHADPFNTVWGRMTVDIERPAGARMSHFQFKWGQSGSYAVRIQSGARMASIRLDT